MNLLDFLSSFTDLFDDTDANEITANCHFRELEEYSSLIGMSIIALAKTQYGKTITGKEIRDCDTVNDLYELIKGK